MTISLRPYQEQALDAIMKALIAQPNVLLQAATAAGKTCIFSELIKRWMTRYPKMNIMVLAHRQELVAQAADKLFQVWPEGRQYVSIACASLGQAKVNRPVIIGSVQTLSTSKRLAKLDKSINLLIIDEVHRLPHSEAGGQYYKLIDRLKENNPKLRILGVTATPYRLGHGYIYGDECREGRTNLFPALDHQIGLDDLTDAGYLAPRIELEKSMGADIKSVKLSSGEYNSVDLSSLMSRSVYIKSAVDAYKKYASDRDKVLVFAVSIEHAKLLAKEFAAAGYEAEAIHSKMLRQTRKSILNRFDHGALRVLINVEILTEGWDSPKVNAIMLCRPTTSPALFVQMIGRGTRLSPGKDNLLVLDLVDNYKAHGDPDHPMIDIPVAKTATAKKAPNLTKECPACGSIVESSNIVCPECGWEWDEASLTDANEDVKMSKVGKKINDGKSEVLSWKAEGRVSFSGNYMLVLEAKCKPGGTIKHWMDIEGEGSDYGRGKAQTLWMKLSGITAPILLPHSVREAELRAKELKMPGRVTIENKKGYKKIKELS